MIQMPCSCVGWTRQAVHWRWRPSVIGLSRWRPTTPTRMLLDLVTPEHVAVLRSKLEAAVGSGPRPKLAAWLPAAVDPTGEGRRQVLEGIGGYREMFLGAGFDEAVERAASGAELDDLVDALPDEAVGAVGLVGSLADVHERLGAYSDAGLDEVALVPMTAGARAASGPCER